MGPLPRLSEGDNAPSTSPITKANAGGSGLVHAESGIAIRAIGQAPQAATFSTILPR